MKRSVSLSRDAFARSFDKIIPFARPWDRVKIPAARGMRGRRKDDGFFFYLEKKGMFSLFAPTLAGTLQEESGKLTLSFRVRRPLFFALLILGWVVLLLAAGLSLIVNEFLFSLVFLVPVPFLLLLLRVRKKDRAELMACLDLILAKRESL